MFADDTNAFLSHKSLETLYGIIIINIFYLISFILMHAYMYA